MPKLNTETAARLFRYTTTWPLLPNAFRITYRFKYRVTDDTFRHSSTCRFWNTRSLLLTFILLRIYLNAGWIIAAERMKLYLIVLALEIQMQCLLTVALVVLIRIRTNLMRTDKKSLWAVRFLSRLMWALRVSQPISTTKHFT